MDKTTQNLEILPAHGPRWERNRKYYLKNTYQSLRSTLLHNIKSNGRIPSEVTKNPGRRTGEYIKKKVEYELSPLKK